MAADPLIVDEDDIDVMVRTLSGEARSEPVVGQVAVAWVIRTRATWKPKAWWGDTIAHVCLKPKQFSCWNDGEAFASNKAHMLALKPDTDEYDDLLDVCHAVLSGKADDPTHGATMYKVKGTPASWDHAVSGIAPVTIGHHQFWRLPPT